MGDYMMVGFHSNGDYKDSKWESKWSPAFKCWIKVPKESKEKN